MKKGRHSQPSFVCPRCAAVSYNLNDIRERYCGRCHVFFDDAERERAAARRDERQPNLFEGVTGSSPGRGSAA
jgi:ribosomal protein S27AE